jgi:type I restriction enzyme S subunit
MAEMKNTKPFYNTEIPNDWAVKRFEQVCNKLLDGTHFSPQSKEGDFKYITSKNIRNQGLDLGNVDYISEEEHKAIYKRCPVKFGDILLTKDGAGTGACCINTLQEEFSLLSSVAVLNANPDFTINQYLQQYIQSPIGQKIIQDEVSGQAITRITLEKIRKFKIPLPPLPVQKAIAQVLSTADAAIHTTEKLIAQKELRKNWLMQQLLTGKKRLKGFVGEWKEKQLGKVIEICSSKRVLEEDWKTEGVPFYRTREIIKLSNEEELKSPIFITEELFIELKAKYGVPKPGDILVTGVGTIGETYVVQAKDKFYFKDGNVIWFKMNDKINSSYLSQLFKTTFIRKQLMDNASITTVATFTIEGAKNTKIKLPSIEEQTAIAQVLQAADKEISLLKAKVEKLREQKKGMMQVLLTGKVRLKI